MKFRYGGLLALALMVALVMAAPAAAFKPVAQPPQPAPEQIVLIEPAGETRQPDNFVSLGQQTFFSARDAAHGRELWRTDGTTAGTERLMDLNPGAADGVEALMAHGGQLFFAGDDGVHGLELWVSDGTAAGSHMITDILTGAAGALERSFYLIPVAAGGAVFFVADDGVHGREIWRTDGTAAGTTRVSTLADDSDWGISDLTVLGDVVFFTAPGAAGRRLWRTDGTPAGTIQVGELRDPQELVVVGDRLYFVAIADSNRELWWADASAAAPHPGGTGFGPPTFPTVNLSSTGDVLYILSNWSKYNCSLSSPTWSFNDACGPQFGPGPHSPTDVGGTVFFASDELWRVGPGQITPTLALDINPVGASNPHSLMAIGGNLYFAADDGVHGRDIWQSNPFTGRTALFADIVLVEGDIRPELLHVNGSTLFFRVSDAQGNDSLWAVAIPETTNSRLYLPLVGGL